jgi:nitroimidazol reductase NimA-like FMN-containing flavoprotein (pyridoxamine 5'-phosphate oxidase superfamily)
MPADDTSDSPASPRTTLRRGAKRAVYEAGRIRSILAAGVVAHVGTTTEDGPVVLPMAYGVRTSPHGGDELLLHGASANALLRACRDLEVCVTVTVVDGLVIARTPFHNSMNYRSVVVRGTATAIDGADDKLAALEVINDHIVATWATARAPSTADVRATLVISVPLDEASAKVRAGDPVDESDDMDGPHWAGVLPLESSWGSPVSARDLVPDAAAVPPAVSAMTGRPAHLEE